MDSAQHGKIYKCIGEVLKEIEPVKKKRQASQFKFRGVEDAMNMLSPILAKNGVFPTTHRIDDIRSLDVESKNGTRGSHYVRRYTFRFFAEDGSYVDTIADGEAIDFGDKASNKCYSVAYREALWKMFVVPFEQDDFENYNPEVASKRKEKVVPEKKDSFEIAKQMIEAAFDAKDTARIEKIRKQLHESKNLSLKQKEELSQIIADKMAENGEIFFDYGTEETDVIAS
jgi:hypothetical protein